MTPNDDKTLLFNFIEHYIYSYDSCNFNEQSVIEYLNYLVDNGIDINNGDPFRKIKNKSKSSKLHKIIIDWMIAKGAIDNKQFTFMISSFTQKYDTTQFYSINITKINVNTMNFFIFRYADMRVDFYL